MSSRKAPRAFDVERELALIGEIYDAGLDPSLWQSVVPSIARAASADSALLFTPFAESAHHLWAGHRIDPAMMTAYAEHYADQDLWTSRAFEQGLKPGDCATSEMLATESELRRSVIWNEMLKPYDIFRMAGMFVDTGGANGQPATSLVIYGSMNREPFGRDSLGLLQRLAPHLRRSLRTNWLLGKRRQQEAATLAVLAALPTALLVCRADAKVIYANPAAESLLNTADGLVYRNDRLAATAGTASAHLAQLIAEACRGPGKRTGGAVLIARPSGARPYTVVVCPLAGNVIEPSGPIRGSPWSPSIATTCNSAPPATS